MGAGYLFEHGLKMLDVPPQYGHIEFGRNGKPRLKSKDWKYSFNLSHSGTYAVCAFSNSEVGVDIQQMAPVVTEKMMRVACTPREYLFLSKLDPATRRNEFYRLWTVKESFMKYLGTGLTIPPFELYTDFGMRIAVWLEGTRQNAYFKEYLVDGYKLTACSGERQFATDFKKVKLVPGKPAKIE